VDVDKDSILREIRRTAELNGGRPLGWQRFLAETGIRETDWLGTHWARWSDAVREAGLRPNRLQQPYEKDMLLEKLATLALALGRVPNRGDLRYRAARDSAFPNPKTFSRLGGKRQIFTQLVEFCQARPGYQRVVELCEPALAATGTPSSADRPPDGPLGFVYLLKSGRYYKIGRSNAVGRREYELGLQLPEPAKLVHRITTDDPVGIEAYWHRRFSDRHKNGEWFELTAADIAAFKRRRGFM
jgi:Meiotically up-regulated gene 113